MPPRKDLDASSSVPAFFGAELRHKREAAGMTLEELARGKFYSVAYLSQIELGDRRMPYDLAVHADEVLGTDGFFQRRCADARKARRGGHAEYFADVAELEQQAISLDEWSPVLVPGLLQTADYARATIRAVLPRELTADLNEKVQVRLERAQLLDNPRLPEFWVVFHELVLRQRVSTPQVMVQQLEHIIGMAESGRIIPQVLPLNEGAHPFMMGMATLMSFADAPPLLYTEGMHSGQLIDDPGLVVRYRSSYDLLRATALAPKASLAMLKDAAKDHRDDANH